MCSNAQPNTSAPSSSTDPQKEGIQVAVPQISISAVYFNLFIGGVSSRRTSYIHRCFDQVRKSRWVILNLIILVLFWTMGIPTSCQNRKARDSLAFSIFSLTHPACFGTTQKASEILHAFCLKLQDKLLPSRQ